MANVVARPIEKTVLWFHVITVSEDGLRVMVAYLPKIAFFWTSSAQHHSGGGKHGTNSEASKVSPIHVVFPHEHCHHRSSVTDQVWTILDKCLAEWARGLCRRVFAEWAGGQCFSSLAECARGLREIEKCDQQYVQKQ